MIIALGLAFTGLSGCATYTNDRTGDEVYAGADADGSMHPDRTIAQNLAGAANYTTFTRAVEAAGLSDSLASAGAYTVLAPTDQAFGYLNTAISDDLMKPSQRPMLTRLVKYHILPGRVTADDIMARVKAGGGSASYRTLSGEDVTFTMAGNVIRVAGMQRSRSSIVRADVRQSNGYIQVLDAVLLPRP